MAVDPGPLCAHRGYLAPSPVLSVPRGPWGGEPNCSTPASALCRSVDRGCHSGFLDRCEELGCFLAAAESKELGLVVKRGKKEKKNNKIGEQIANNAEGMMEACIVRNTSWTAAVFELEFFSPQKHY